MRRSSPLASPVGFVLTFLLFFGLGFSLWSNRGLAFSPGQVTGKVQPDIILQGYTSHADFEQQCGFCHEPLRVELAEKCVQCHVEIKDQMATGEGVHSKVQPLQNCHECHPEHKGRKFDPTQAAYKVFDHSVTTFSLVWHQINFDATPMECAACHHNDHYFVVEYDACVDCHISQDNSFIEAHSNDFGEGCLACHDGQDRMTAFDHNTTSFTLEGKHMQANCADCHVNNLLQGTPQTCAECHTEPAAHQGIFELQCETCHTPQGWAPAQLDGQPFDHALTTGFSLIRHPVDQNGESITCTACHSEGSWDFSLQVCTDCHAQADQEFIARHQEQFGTSCLDCHDGVDRMSDFDHANFFPLTGRHFEVECMGCHEKQNFRAVPTECNQCHAEPEIHAGVFGLECQNCHGVETWGTAMLTIHGFPLGHGEDETSNQSDCQTCHLNNYVEYTCYGCHFHQPEAIAQSHDQKRISEQDLPACALCHPLGLIDDTQ